MLKEHSNLADILDFEFSDDNVTEINKLQEKGDVKVTTIINSEKKVSLKDQFVMAFTSNLRALAELNISQNELKVITYILEVMEYGNLISINQTAIAKEQIKCFICIQKISSKKYFNKRKRSYLYEFKSVRKRFKS
ncbi:hypothetical protein [Pantoea brenneri]|uniref:hypothetical protein n=1 Tax=Pantoea brenneri TaxID=472694 RepID=UPI000851A913|nr:hypothetical protein [Pantoea brenneri]